MSSSYICRVTVRLLQINEPARIEERQLLLTTGEL